MKFQDLWVIEYSPSQKSIHVDSVGNTIARNGRNIRKGISNDYMMVGLYETSEIAHRQADRFSENLIETLGLLVDTPQRLTDVLPGTTYGLTPTEVESFYDQQESNLFSSEWGDKELPIDYRVIADKSLMDLTEADFEEIELYKVNTPPEGFDVVYSCQNRTLTKIYFTPNERSYSRRGFRLREEEEIMTTQQLIDAVRKWRHP